MKSSDLKEYIIEQNCIDAILEDLGCGNIVSHGNYITCSNPDGNNKNAITVYNDSLTVVNYTRCIAKNKRATDIFDLVSFYRDCSFPEALRYVHELLGLDYYQEREEPCESLQILRMLKDMSLGSESEEDSTPLKPIPEKVLEYYLPYPNKLFEDDGISLDVQQEFGLGYDAQSNRITMPLLSPTGDLCGVKGRLFGEADEYNPKYMYIFPTAKAKLLYGLYENRSYIKNSNYLYIFEAEKSVLQCATMGVRNAVATGGKTISASQIELITRTSCTPILALDKDVKTDELKDIASMFMDGISVYAIIDYEDILDEKESPSDNPKKWDYLIKNHIYKIKGGDADEQQTSA